MHFEVGAEIGFVFARKRDESAERAVVTAARNEERRLGYEGRRRALRRDARAQQGAAYRCGILCLRGTRRVARCAALRRPFRRAAKSEEARRFTDAR